MPTLVTTINLIVGQTHTFQLLDVANGNVPISKANVTISGNAGLFNVADAGNSGWSFQGIAPGTGSVSFAVPGYTTLVEAAVIVAGTLGLAQTS
ncbi:MAG TPA: hypothetical protein VGR84_18855 [Candidatus Acidoferrales bacterium]|nr:hypothetical protein [Candidatus Acidoferrales bacterium]